jgi:hypothetical protein
MFLLFLTVSLLNFAVGYGVAIMLGLAKSPFGKRSTAAKTETDTHNTHGHATPAHH